MTIGGRLLPLVCALIGAFEQSGLVPDLSVGEVVERQITGGGVDRHTVRLSAGQFAQVRLEQLGVDVSLTLHDPNGQFITQRDGPWTVTDPEVLSMVAASSGAYSVSVEFKAPPDKRGRYRLVLRERRDATPIDTRRVIAEQSLEGTHALFKPATMQQAVASYTSAAGLFRELQDKEWQAHATLMVGRAHLARDEIDAARDRFNEVADLWASMKDESREARALNYVAVTALRRGDNRAAVDVSLRALPLARRSGNTSSEASALMNLASANWMLGDRRAEAEYQEQALATTRRLDDPGQLAVMLNNRGVSLQTIGEHQKALAYLRESLEIQRTLKDERGQAAALNTIGEIYRQLGLLPEATTYHQQALDLRRQADDRAGIAQSLSNLGLVYRSSGEIARARAALEEALGFQRAASNRRGEAATLLNLAALAYVEMKDVDRGLAYLAESLSIREAIDDVPGQANVLIHLGRAYVLRGDETRGRDYLTRALDVSRRVRDSVVEVDVLQRLAQLAEARGELEIARAHLESAIEVVEGGRRLLVGDALKASFLATRADLYGAYIDVLMRLHDRQPTAGYAARAFKAVELSRARSLLDSLQDAGVDLSADADPRIVQRVADLQQRLNVAARRESALTGATQQRQRAAVADEIRQLLTEYDELRAEMRTSHPRLAALSDPDVLSLNDIQTRVVDGRTVLLEYAFARERGYLWAITPERVDTFVVPGSDRVETLARQAHRLLTARNQRDNVSAEQRRQTLQRNEAELATTLRELSRVLVEPVAPLLGDKRLLIVTTGALQYVPFAALPSPRRGVPLVVTNEIVTLPSASVVAALRDHRTAHASNRRLVAVVADPVFTTDDPRVTAAARAQISKGTASPRIDEADWQWAARSVRATATDGSLPRLRYSRDEALAIRGLTQSNDRLMALDFAASRDTLMRRDLEAYNVVHIASHGFVDADHPELSGIALSMVDATGRPVDGFLRLHDIYNLKLRADLVVLSACQTAFGPEIKGEGIMSLTRGFMYAGASAVAATLWMVDDQATAELMKLFYAEMLGPRAQSPAAALRSAQIALMKQPRWQSPYYWAAFTFQGDWR